MNISLTLAMQDSKITFINFVTCQMLKKIYIQGRGRTKISLRAKIIFGLPFFFISYENFKKMLWKKNYYQNCEHFYFRNTCPRSIYPLSPLLSEPCTFIAFMCDKLRILLEFNVKQAISRNLVKNKNWTQYTSWTKKLPIKFLKTQKSNGFESN